MKRGREELGPPGSAPKRPAGGPMARPVQQAGMGQRLTTNDALTYLREVKNRFADKKDVYDTFLEIMKEFKAQRIDTAGVIQRVKELFRGHKELVLGFNTFLPKGYEIQLADVADMDDDGNMAQNKQPVEFDQAINYVNKIKTRFATDERVYKAFLEILNMYRKGQKTITNVYDEVAVLFRQHSDLLAEFTYFLPDNSPPQAGNPLIARGPGRWLGSKPMPGSNRMVMHGRPGGGGGYGGGPAKGGFNQRKRSGEHEEGSGRGSLTKELQFFEKVKQRLRSRESYQDFLKCLNLFASEIISRQELMHLANDIIGRYPDLVSGFHSFLARCESMDSFDQEIKAFTGNAKVGPKDLARLKGASMRDKFLTKPISELAAETSTEDRCTTSYVRMPAGYPKLICSGRTPLGDSVLNDEWVSIVSGSEDYSFKLMRKNQYEEALFRCEDDRYELDMCIETNAATLRRLQPLNERIAAMAPEDKAAFRLPEDALGPVHFRAVERIYGDQGATIVDLLKKNPTVAVPVVLVRLAQKEAEWRRVREEMNKVWKKVFEQNYHRSLDHRSFYFKQADKKGLLPKSMLAEVREAADRRRADERHLRALAVGCPLSDMLQPDLTYDFRDMSVFEDVYQVVMYAVEETLSGEAREGVRAMWLSMVEPFFGLARRDYAPLHAKGDESKRGKGAKDSSSEEADEGGDKDGDVAESGGDALGGDPNVTPEPERGAKAADALAALAAAGAGAMDTEGERSHLEGEGKREESAEGPAMDDGHDDGDSDAAAARASYALCKPLASQANAAAAAAAAAATAAAASSSGPPDPQARRQHVLYANDNVYLFFRYHRYLYDRMCVMWRCCREKNQPQFRQTGEAPRAQDEASTAAQAAETQRLHASFMGLVRRLLDGKMDSNSFEDTVRALLGTNSYVLFTLDKLVYKLVKHMQVMVGDEQTSRLWELHAYERARLAPISDEVYRANASILLHDDNCYRFEFHEQATKEQQATAAAQAAAQQQDSRAATPPPDMGGHTGCGAAASAADRGAVLTVQLLEADKSEAPPTALEPVFAEYIKGFMSSPAGANKDAVFLNRNVARSPPAAGAAAAAAADEALMEALANVRTRNGLECKISCSNSRVSYVLDTEDVMFRQRAKGAPKPLFNTETRMQRFAAYLQQREEAMQPLSQPPSVHSALVLG